MLQDMNWIFAFNLIINSFLAYFTIGILLKIFIFFFRVKNPRFLSILLCVPIFKLILDPFLYDFSRWTYFHDLNPLHAEANSRLFSATICCPDFQQGFFPIFSAIGFSMKDGLTFTLADIISYAFPQNILKGFILIFATITLFSATLFTIRLINSILALFKLTANAYPCNRELKHPDLIKKIKDKKIQLILSNDISTPCAFSLRQNWICLPSHLIDNLTDQEFEAIIAHELTHLECHDGLLRLLCTFLASLFWWIPMKRRLNSIERAQELACDRQINTFHIKRSSLLSAIFKTLQAEKESSALPIFASSFAKESYLKKRIRALLTESFEMARPLKWIQFFGIGIISLSLIFGKFWIF